MPEPTTSSPATTSLPATTPATSPAITPQVTSPETFPPLETDAPDGNPGGGLDLPEGPAGPGEDRDRDIYTALREGRCDHAAENLNRHWDDVRSPRDVLLYQAAIELCQENKAGAREWLKATTELGLEGLAVPVATRDKDGAHILFAYYCEVYRTIRSVLEGRPREEFPCPSGDPPAWPDGQRDDPRTPTDESTATTVSDSTAPPTQSTPNDSAPHGSSSAESRSTSSSSVRPTTTAAAV
jgi:hypothetical protein